MGGVQVISTRQCFDNLTAEFNVFAMKMRNGLLGKTFIIPRAAMLGYRFPSGLYGSSCTIPLALVLIDTVSPTLAAVSWLSLHA